MVPEESLKVDHLERPFKMMRAILDAGIFAVQQAVFSPSDWRPASSPASSVLFYADFSDPIKSSLFLFLVSND